MPTISVIVPVYNAEKYLNQCLDSLTKQTFHDIEIICVDDGSTDQSAEILHRYAEKDKRIHVHTQQNQGVAYARNTAMQYATGEWLAFCDADDTVPVDAYQSMLDVAKNVDIVIGSYCVLDDKGEKTQIQKRGKFQDNLFYAVFQMPTVWTTLMRHEFVQNRNIQFQDVLVGEDFIFLAECISSNPSYKVINKPVYYYRYNSLAGQSLTHRYDYAHFAGHIHCRNELIRICGEKNYSSNVYDYLYQDALTYPLEYLLRIQSIEEKNMALGLYKEYISQFDWSKDNCKVECILGMSYEDFKNSPAEVFFSKIISLKPEEAVLKRYEAGLLGFRYILKYIRAWTQYKINSLNWRKK